MPNWCQNILTIECCGEQLEQFKAKLFSLDEKGNFYLDFNRLVPMPLQLQNAVAMLNDSYKLLLMNGKMRFSDNLIQTFIIESEIERITKLAKRYDWSIKSFLKWLKRRPDEQKRLGFDWLLARQYADNFVKYGSTNWYEWSYANWGCKWDAFPDNCCVTIQEDGSICCDFDTAWNPPDEWFRALCKAFPEHQMRLAYFEPGMWFAGEYIADADGHCYPCPIEDDAEMKAFALREFGWDFDDDDDLEF